MTWEQKLQALHVAGGCMRIPHEHNKIRKDCFYYSDSCFKEWDVVEEVLDYRDGIIFSDPGIPAPGM